MKKSEVKVKVTLNNLLLVLLCVIVIIIPNGTTVSKIFKVVYGVFSLIYLIRYKRVVWNYYLAWLSVTVIIAYVSVFWALSREYALAGAQTILLNGICAFLFVQLATYNVSWRNVIYKCLALFPILRLLSLVITFGLSIFRGLRGIIQDASYNLVGIFAAMGVVFCVLILSKKTEKSFFWNIVLILDLTACVISMSRRAIIYLIIPIIFLYIFSDKNIVKRVARICTMLVCVLLAWVSIMNIKFLYFYIGEGIMSIVQSFNNTGRDASAVGRLIRIEYGLSWFASRPFYGYGARNFNYMFTPLWKSSAMVVADNNFIEMLVSYGILGIVIYYYIYVKTSLMALKNKQTLDKEKIMMSGVLLALFISDFGTSSYIYMYSQIYLAIAVYTILGSEKTLNNRGINAK